MTSDTHIVYGITHNPSGRYYIGKTSRRNWESGYMGSGKAWGNIVEKYPLEEFYREIIDEFDSEDAAYAEEEFWIGDKFRLDPLCMNLVPGGVKPPVMRGEDNPMFGAQLSGENNPFYGKKHSEESRTQMSEAHRGKPAWNRGVPHTEEARMNMSENHADVSGDNNPFHGKKHSEESRQKMSESKRGDKNWRRKTSKIMKELNCSYNEALEEYHRRKNSQ